MARGARADGTSFPEPCAAHVTRYPSGALEADLDFHYAAACGTQNEVLVRVLRTSRDLTAPAGRRQLWQ